jgi:protein-disulfide isomerase
LIVAFALPILLWLIIKPLLQKSQDAERWRGELRRFKNNPALFEALLHQQRQMPPVPADLQTLILGNPAAEHIITMVTNPYCGPCAKAHIQLEEVLAENPNLKAQIIFAVCHDPDGRKTQVAKHMMALGSLPLPSEGKGLGDGVDAWYAQNTKNYDTWAAHYPADVSIVPDNIITAHCDWTKMANIEGTPTFFVDGYEIPHMFGLAQSAYLVNNLIYDLAK